MKDYKELYKKLIDDNIDTERINRINEIVFDMMKDLPDPELWEMLCEEFPNCDPDIVFLEDTELADLVERDNGDAIFSAIREYKDRVNLDDLFLIYWNGEVETVNSISDISYVFDWDFVFDDLLFYRLWDYIDVEDDPELVALFNAVFSQSDYDRGFSDGVEDLLGWIIRQMIDERVKFADVSDISLGDVSDEVFKKLGSHFSEDNTEDIAWEIVHMGLTAMVEDALTKVMNRRK